MQTESNKIMDFIKAELAALDAQSIDIEGQPIQPSKCYHFQFNPTHLMFNTNCPDSLREQVEAIVHKYLPDESRTQ